MHRLWLTVGGCMAGYADVGYDMSGVLIAPVNTDIGLHG